MTPIPRRIGWILMFAALGVAVAARQFGMSNYGPFPALVIVLLVGGIGVMLVLTDMMVRGLYAQVDAAAGADAKSVADSPHPNPSPEEEGLPGSEAAKSESVAAGDAPVSGDGDDVAVGGNFDRT
ncbi:MAG: hypothetical protein SFV20_02475 [Sphingopyxis sp.]|nr:hypothetical protein [Sphingopyxis sp.]